MARCFGDGNPLLEAYHDDEWGIPAREDPALIELFTLSTMQIGLSWSLILTRRNNLRQAFRGFDPKIVAAFSHQEVDALLKDNGIIRNRRKVEAAVSNSRAILSVSEEWGSFSAFVWSFTEGAILRGQPLLHWKNLPTESVESRSMSSSMKNLGFRLVGPTVCYAFMQSAGIVDDHIASCPKFLPPR